MRILIVGHEESPQSQALNALKAFTQQLPEPGSTIEHTFRTKYFEKKVSIWIDRYTCASEWCKEFTSEEAAEVLDAVAVLVYTYETPEAQLGPFFKKLRDRGWPGIVMAVGEDENELFETYDIDVVPLNELLDAVHSALVDIDVETEEEPLVDLGEIVAELKAARESDMSADEKKELVERLTGLLCPDH